MDEVSLGCEGCTNLEQIIGDPNNLILEVQTFFCPLIRISLKSAFHD